MNKLLSSMVGHVSQEMNGTVVKKEHREDGPIKVDVDETNPLFKA